MLSLPICEEHATLQYLTEYSSANALVDVSEVQDGNFDFVAQLPLFQIFQGKLVNDMLFAFEELEKLEICFWPAGYDCRGALAEHVLATGITILESTKASCSLALYGDVPKARPSDSVHEVGREGPIIEPRGIDRHIGGPPCNVGQAPAADVPRAEVLEERMDTMLTFVLATAIAGATHDVEEAQPHPCQLLLEDHADIQAFLAWAIHDVRKYRGPSDGRAVAVLPFASRSKGSDVHHCDLEP